MHEFWQSHGIWPETTPLEDDIDVAYEGPSPNDLDTAACVECGSNVWRSQRGLYVAEYDNGPSVGTVATTVTSCIAIGTI